MKKAAIVVLIVAVVGLFGAHSMARSDLSDLLVAAEVIEEQVVDELIQAKGEPECCNKCGACNRAAPEISRCQCLDPSTKCHPHCTNCVMSQSYPPLFVCLDMNFISYFACHRPCKSTASKFVTN